MKKLPMTHRFEDIRQNNKIYVDKTQHIMEFLEGGYLFFGRPKRFGKSLLLSTLQAAFEGKKELFQGLWLENNYHFEPQPVIHLDLCAISSSNIEKSLLYEIKSEAKRHEIEIKDEDPHDAFRHLMETLYDKTQKRIALLVNNYDKPIYGYLDEPETCKKHGRLLESVFGQLKGMDRNLHLVLLTGETKYHTSNMFSGFNNIQNVTLHDRFSQICGFTENELKEYFADYHLIAREKMGLSEKTYWERLEKWYGGYSWDGRNKLYCPHSIIFFFQRLGFHSFIGEYTRISHVIKKITKNTSYSINLDNMHISNNTLIYNDPESPSNLGLMFQRGFLTIKNKENNRGTSAYTVGYPNYEAYSTAKFYFSMMYFRRQLYSQEIKLFDAMKKEQWNVFNEELDDILIYLEKDKKPKTKTEFVNIIYLVLSPWDCEIKYDIKIAELKIEFALIYEEINFLFIIEFIKELEKPQTKIEILNIEENYIERKTVFVKIKYTD